MTDPLALELARFVDIPLERTEAVLPVLRLSLYDWAACGLAGRDEPVAQVLRAQPAEDGPAAIFGGGGRAPAQAALINGTISHALDYDDTHFAHIGHPSVVVASAVLAIAPDALDAAEIEAAILLGAESSVRVGEWLGRRHYETGFHMTATAGAIGATLGCCRALGLDPDRTAHALGLVATRAAGLKSQFGTMGKPFNAGQAAEAAVLSAELARAGFISNPQALDGPQGFGPTHAGEGNRAAFEGMNETWRFEQISHKYHACCHGLHAMLEAVRDLDAPEPDRIEAVTITTHPRWLAVCNQPEPRTGLEAKFSYRLTAALALSGHDTGALDTFRDDLATDPRLCALRDRVSVETDDRLPETAARIRVTSADGAVLDAARDIAEAGTLAQRAENIRRKGRALLDARTEERLWNATGRRLDRDALSGIIRTSQA